MERGKKHRAFAGICFKPTFLIFLLCQSRISSKLKVQDEWSRKTLSSPFPIGIPKLQLFAKQLLMKDLNTSRGPTVRPVGRVDKSYS